MRILLTNDDGINAPGLAALERIAAELSDDVWCVAPETDQSGLAHSLTLNEPLRLRKLGPKKFALKGTPTDCVIMGIRELMDGAPDIVLSGVNSGQNIGDDVTYSGTVAGAMEGTLMGVRSIALSQGYDWNEGLRTVKWQTAEAHSPGIIDRLMQIEMPPKTLFNVNFPNCEPDQIVDIEITRQGSFVNNLGMDKRHDGRGFPYYWLKFGREVPDQRASTDIIALRENRVSITPLQLDLTHEGLRETLKTVF